ncbi:GGDEF domain-containing protein [Sporolactobacillus kofuensis]|uniref:GGDEF domain-containing protein n=1 Tax=Sporolactobacillus kofuensis TaxID=269672 RepID=A0ABW1WF48_9BACL|nr:GGDEF domain-containing protein [Sporolactobacillus kofuensis]MCO7175381.1 GGDEF domain-containing protein [Sporolactobacillus kofuensis]
MKEIFKKSSEQNRSDVHESDRRFSIYCNTMFLFALVAHFLFVPVFYQLGNRFVFITNIIAVCLDLACLLLKNRGYLRVAGFIWVFEIVVHASICILAFGWNLGFYYYFLSLVPIVFFSRWHVVVRFLLTGILFAALLFFYFYTKTVPPITRTSAEMSELMYLLSVTLNFIGLGYAAFYYRSNSEKLERKLSMLAHTDVLTGVDNRRSFERLAQKELARQLNHHKPCALILFDIDHFKKINDTFGHAVGDMALQKMAEVCEQVLREQDHFGRIGGEEFAVFLAHTSHDEAAHIAERLRKTISACQIELDGGTQVALSASVGFTVPKAKHDELPQLMIRADKALYQAKREGRNRVASVI